MKIKFDNVTVGYENKPIIEGLSFECASGESLCLLGPNGIGKTTMFRTILRFISPLAGSITVDDKNLLHFKQKEIATTFSYVPQAKNYSYQYSVEEIVMMGRAVYIPKLSSPGEKDRVKVLEAMERLDIAHMAKLNYSELSGGEQQIVLIARALAQEAEFIIMDEPASNLDFSNQKKLLTVIKNMKKLGKGIIIASHNPDHAFACCDNALLVSRDKSYSVGPVEDVVTSENLSKAFGVEIQVIKQMSAEQTVTACSLII